MTITLGIFLTYLEDMCPVYNEKVLPTRAVNGLLFFTPKSFYPEKNAIYMCPYHRITEERLQSEDYIVFTILPQNEIPDMQKNVIYFPSHISFMEIANRYHHLMNQFTSWDKTAHQLLLEGCSFDEYINHGTRIIPYPIQFFDPSLNVTAMSIPEVDVPSEFYDSAEIGYAPPDVFSKIQHSNILAQLQRSSKAIVKPSITKKEDFVIYRCHKTQNNVIGYTLVYCGTTKPDQGLVDICELFFTNLDLYYLSTQKAQQTSANMYGYFLSALMSSHKGKGEKWISDRAKSVQIPTTSNFQLVKMHFDENTDAAKYVCNLLHRYFPHLYAFLFEGELFLLLFSKNLTADKPAFDTTLKQIDEILDKYQYRYYISNPFTYLSDIYYARKQCNEMQEITSSKQISYGKHMHYLDFIFYHCFHYLERDYDLDFLVWPQYKKICQYDAEYNTNYAQTLKEFLKNNGSLKETADALGMHRNSIDKRIKKIESLFDINLSNLQSMILLHWSIALAEYKK